MPKIAVIDYGLGNLQSIQNKLKILDVDSIISSDPDEIAKASKLILPGVGAFENGIKNLKKMNLISLLNQRVLKDKVPILGICLGMQLFSSKSEEGLTEGLGWVNCTTIKFNIGEGKNPRLKIPHIGWNTLTFRKNAPIMAGITTESYFYFLHSYHLECLDRNIILATTDYGYTFVSSIQKDNIIGVQFHPEKSHASGLQILKNFAESL